MSVQAFDSLLSRYPEPAGPNLKGARVRSLLAIRVLIRHHTLAAAVAVAGILIASNAFADSAASEAAHARKAHKADRDCEDVVFPDGTVAECPSVEASQTAVIAHAKHVDVTCPLPTHEEGHDRCVLD